MAKTRIKNWTAEILTHTDLNAEFDNLINTPMDLISPAPAALDMDGQELIMDGDGDSSLTMSIDDQLDVKLGGSDIYIFTTTTLTAPAVTASGLITANAGMTVPTGFDVTLTDAPSADTDAANKAYVDTQISQFPVGTRIVFQQTAAPTGWTKDTSITNAALRLTDGTVTSGGADNFSTIFGTSKSTASYTLLEADVPAHDHGSGGAHTHTVSTGSIVAGSSVQGGLASSGSINTGSSGTHTHTSFGGGGGHAHTLSNMNIKYQDVIVAQKD